MRGTNLLATRVCHDRLRVPVDFGWIASIIPSGVMKSVIRVCCKKLFFAEDAKDKKCLFPFSPPNSTFRRVARILFLARG